MLSESYFTRPIHRYQVKKTGAQPSLAPRQGKPLPPLDGTPKAAPSCRPAAPRASSSLPHLRCRAFCPLVEMHVSKLRYHLSFYSQDSVLVPAWSSCLSGSPQAQGLNRTDGQSQPNNRFTCFHCPLSKPTSLDLRGPSHCLHPDPQLSQALKDVQELQES